MSYQFIKHLIARTVYVRPYENEDMSTYVKKINFKLHDSYANQNRVLTKPPYEVTETGWGEFEIVIKIYFQDPNERPVSCFIFFEKQIPF
jgi:YEATS domain-containing protein 4